MKWMKWPLFAAVALFLATETLVPQRLVVNTYQAVSKNRNTVLRCLNDAPYFKKWWPGGVVGKDSVSLGKYAGTYHPKPLGMRLTSREFPDCEVQIMPYGNDSVVMNMQFDTMYSGFSPVKKWESFAKASYLKKRSKEVLDSLTAFLKNDSAVYGLKISEERVTDSTLLSAKKYFDRPPSQAEINSLLKEVKDYALAHGKQTGNPMVNTWQDSGRNVLMVAWPTNGSVSPAGPYAVKRMVLGKIMVSEVTGGDSIVMRKFQNMHDYIDDYNHIMPAIPFFQYMTDRSQEPDPAKWVTLIKFPTF